MATEYLDKAGLQKLVELIQNDLAIPQAAGIIYPYAGNIEAIPDGFLYCNGEAVSRETYAALFAVIGTTYGSGDGSTTFNLPNLRYKVPMGASNDYPLGSVGGAATHKLTTDEMPSHRHQLKTGYSYVGFEATAGINESKAWSDVDNDTYAAYWSSNIDMAAIPNQVLVGGNAPHNNLQPYQTVNYIISTGKETIDVKTIISAIQALPLAAEYGGTGTTSKQQFYSEYRLKKFEAGMVSVEPSAANVPTLVSVTFDEPFDTVPNVYVTPETSVPGTTVLGCGCANITETGFDVSLTRADTQITKMNWLAIEQ